jgi:hypothetical protein
VSTRTLSRGTILRGALAGALGGAVGSSTMVLFNRALAGGERQ